MKAETNVKQRIMGLIILVAIALIFVPILFSRSGSPTAPASNIQAKNAAAPNLATPPVVTQVPVNPPPAALQTSQPNDVATAQTAPDQIVFQSNTNTDQTTPDAAQQAPFPSENQQVASAEQPQVAESQPAEVQQADAAPSVAAVNPENNPNDPNNLAANQAIAPSDNNLNVQQAAVAPANPIPSEQTATNPNPETTPNNLANTNSIAQPETNVQPETANAAPATNGIATSESNVLDAAQQQFTQPTPQKSKPATHTAKTHHAKSLSLHSTHAAKLQEKKSAAKEQGWIIQLGSFAQQKNVERLIQQLHTHGFVAHVAPIHTSHGIITRVYLGPELQKERADHIAKQINAQLSIHSIVIPG
jgi:cell division septation protein DedD